MGVQNARFGAARVRQVSPLCDDEEYGHNNECWAIEVVGQDWSSEVVAHFLEDWELGRVALSCHMAMDLLCPEMMDACWVSSELFFFCDHSASEVLVRNRHRNNAFLSPWKGFDKKGVGCGEREEK